MFPYILLIKCSRIWIINVTETNNVAANMISYCSRLPSVLLYLSMRRICFSWVCFSCSCAFPVCLCVCVCLSKLSSNTHQCETAASHWNFTSYCIGFEEMLLVLLDRCWMANDIAVKRYLFCSAADDNIMFYYGHFDYFFFFFSFYSCFLLWDRHKCDAFSYHSK